MTESVKADWLVRAKDELQVLQNRINSLEFTVKRPPSVISDEHLTLMTAQLVHMKQYAVLLNRRVNG